MSGSVQERVKLLQVKRDTIERNITNFKIFFDNFDQIHGNELEVQVRLANLMSSFSNLDHIEDDLISMGQPESGNRLVLQDQYFDVSCKAQQFLKSRAVLNQHSDNGSVASQSGTMRDDSIHQLKFKSIPLPTFSGEYSEWSAFKNKFLSYVNARRYSKIDKLTLLQQAMKGDASSKIDYLDPEDGNYEKAWTILELSYENKKMIKMAHFSKLLRVPKLSTDNHKSVSNLADVIVQASESLASLGVELHSDFLVSLIEMKLDANTLKLWEEHSSHEDFEDLDKITRFLYRTAARLSATQAPNTNKKRPSNISSEGNKKLAKIEHHQEVRKVFVASERKCLACEGSYHPLFQCKKFIELSVSDRFDVAKKHKLCFNCLRKHSGDCRFGPCPMCGKKHNKLLHKTKRSDAPSNPEVNNSDKI